MKGVSLTAGLWWRDAVRDHRLQFWPQRGRKAADFQGPDETQSCWGTLNLATHCQVIGLLLSRLVSNGVPGTIGGLFHRSAGASKLLHTLYPGRSLKFKSGLSPHLTILRVAHGRRFCGILLEFERIRAVGGANTLCRCPLLHLLNVLANVNSSHLYFKDILFLLYKSDSSLFPPPKYASTTHPLAATCSSRGSPESIRIIVSVREASAGSVRWLYSIRVITLSAVPTACLMDAVKHLCFLTWTSNVRILF